MGNPYGGCPDTKMSADLKWLLVRNYNCFQIKRDGITFSTEPQNLTNLSTYKYSGLANDKAIGVDIATIKGEDEEKTMHKIKLKTKAGHSKQYGREGLPKRDIESIAGRTAGRYYRTDLKAAAVARYLKLRKSLLSTATEKSVVEGLQSAAKKDSSEDKA